MTETNKYSALRQISVLMSLDTAVLVADDVLFLLGMTPLGIFVSNFRNYGVWMVSTLRLMVCSLILVSLSRLSNLRGSFGKARIWYFLNFLVYLVQNAGITVFNYRYPNPASFSYSDALFFAKILLTILLALYFGELSISCGNRAVLFAGAELLEMFGLEDPAGKNRRCGKRLLMWTAVQTFFLLFGSVLLVWVLFVNRVFPLDDNATLVLFLSAAAFLLFFLFRQVVTVFRVLAAVHMNRAYRAIRELTE